MPSDPNRQRVAIRYRAGDGNWYAVVTTRNHAVAINATGAQDIDPPLPTKWKPRLVNGLQVSAGRDRTIHLVEPDDTTGIWRGTTNSINVLPYGAFEITGRSGERRTQGAPGYDGSPTPPNERVSIKYTADNNQSYAIVTTRSHASAVGAESGAGFPSFPDVWTPRHINCFNPILSGRDQKLVLVMPDKTAAKWMSDAQVQFTVNGVTFDSTGRKQESRPRSAPPFTP